MKPVAFGQVEATEGQDFEAPGRLGRGGALLNVSKVLTCIRLGGLLQSGILAIFQVGWSSRAPLDLRLFEGTLFRAGLKGKQLETPPLFGGPPM